jgi:hypothetical protein
MPDNLLFAIVEMENKRLERPSIHQFSNLVNFHWRPAEKRVDGSFIVATLCVCGRAACEQVLHFGRNELP